MQKLSGNLSGSQPCLPLASSALPSKLQSRDWLHSWRNEASTSVRVHAGQEASISGSSDDWERQVMVERGGFGTFSDVARALVPHGSKRGRAVEFIKRFASNRLKDGSSEGSLRYRIDQPSLLAISSTAALPGGGWNELSHNYIFQAGFWGWFIAQFLKIFTKKYKQGVWDLRALIESGGMPSSHSALTAAVTTAVALEFGLGSSLFAVALCFTVITMYDAAGVRRHAGHPVSDRKLKEVLGHTPIQVVSGAILGVIVACFVPSPTNMQVV